MKKKNKFNEVVKQCDSAIEIVKAAMREGESMEAINRARSACEVVLRKLDEALADLQRRKSN
jgi:hypothetical protein